jgi:copper transport protein
VAAAIAARRGVGRRAGLLLAALAVPLVATPALAGHARTEGLLAETADVAHVAAAAAWTGGLAALVAALVLAGADRWALAARAVPRFSALAVGAVAVLVAAGTVNGVVQVGALRGLWETTYGVLLVVKVGLVLPLVALGAYNNRYAVPRLAREIASRVEQRRFLHLAGVELSLMVVVVALTAVLVAEPPAKAEVQPRGPFATEAALGPLTLNLVVDPARAGPNAVHAYLLDRAGQPVHAPEVKLAARLPSRSIGPLRVTAPHIAPGHYSARGVDLAVAGDWQLRVSVRLGEFDAYDTTLSIPIRKD